MVFDKVAKLGVAMAMLGLVVLTSCSENDNGMASSYSETQTGKPVIRECPLLNWIRLISAKLLTKVMVVVL